MAQDGLEIVQRVCTFIKTVSDHDWHRMQSSQVGCMISASIRSDLEGENWMCKNENQRTPFEFGRLVGRRPLISLPETMKRPGVESIGAVFTRSSSELDHRSHQCWCTWRSVLGFQNRFRKLSIDVGIRVCLLYHGPNDLRQVSTTPMHRHGAHKTHQIGPANPGFHSLLSNQEWALMRVLRRTVQPLQPLQPHWADKSITQNMINDLQNRAQQMIQSAQHRRAQPILATHALRAQPGDTGDVARTRVAESAQLLQMMPEQVIEGFDAYNDMIRKMAKQRNLPTCRCTGCRWSRE